MLPLSEKVKVLKERKKSHAEVARIYHENPSSIYEVINNEKEIVPVLLSCFKLKKLWPECVIYA